MELSEDHKATLESEEARIREAGGWVHRGRTLGVLAIARSFGDLEFKTMKESCWGRTFSADLIVATPVGASQPVRAPMRCLRKPRRT